MSIATVVTRGFLVGSAVGVASVATRGYGNTSTGQEVIGRPVFRRKTRIWSEEELAGIEAIPEVQIAETRADEYASLNDQHEYLEALLAENAELRNQITDAKNRARLAGEKSSLLLQIRELNKAIAASEVRLAAETREADRALERHRKAVAAEAKRRLEEEEAAEIILLYMLNHRDN